MHEKATAGSNQQVALGDQCDARIALATLQIKSKSVLFLLTFWNTCFLLFGWCMVVDPVTRIQLCSSSVQKDAELTRLW